MIRSCQSLASILQFVERNLVLLVTSASDLPLHMNKFCSVLFCSSWSSMLVVIKKKIHWCMAVSAINCTVDGRSCCSHVQQSSIDSQLFVENHDLCLPHPHSTPQLRRPLLPLPFSLRNIAIRFSVQKLEWFGYPMVKKVWGYDYSFWQNSRTRQTDGQTIGRAYA